MKIILLSNYNNIVMPEITELYQNNLNSNVSEWASEWLFIADVAQFTFSVYCDKNCSFGVRWSIDENYDIDYLDSDTLLANSTKSITVPIRARYAQFYVNTFASLPCHLKTQGIYNSIISDKLINPVIGPTGATGAPGSACNTGATGPIGSIVTLFSTGATGSISPVAYSTGPNLFMKGMTGGTGINIVDNNSTLIINNTERYYFAASGSGNQTISSINVYMPLILHSNQYFNGFSINAGNTAAICNVATPYKYLISGGFGSDFSGGGSLYIRHNGVDLISQYANVGQQSNFHCNLQVVRTLTNGDVIDLCYNSHSGTGTFSFHGIYLTIVQL